MLSHSSAMKVGAHFHLQWSCANAT